MSRPRMVRSDHMLEPCKQKDRSTTMPTEWQSLSRWSSGVRTAGSINQRLPKVHRWSSDVRKGFTNMRRRV